MKGFDTKFTDFPDYILGITKEIWEDRGLATLNHYYGEDMYLRMPMGFRAAIKGDSQHVGNAGGIPGSAAAG